MAWHRLTLWSSGCRKAITGAFAALFFSLAAAHAAERVPADPVFLDSNRTGNFEIFFMKLDGTEATQLTHDRAYDSFWPKPSPDRKSILFVRAPAGVHDKDYSKVTTWIMDASSGGLKQILPAGAHGWSIQGHPEWKPDGTKIATIGGANHNSQIFLINPDGTHPVRVTSNGSGKPRGGMNLDPSWHPGGASLLFTGCPGFFCFASSYEIYRVNADGSGETRLTNDGFADYDPYYLPSGKEIAWLRNISGARWAVYRMRPDGTGQQSVIDDGGINSKPAWRDDFTIYFHRIPSNPPVISLFNIWKIAPNGTNPTEIVQPRPPYVNEYPAAAY